MVWLEICRRGFGDFYPVTAVGLQSTIVYRVTVPGSGSDSGFGSGSGLGPYFGCSFGIWDFRIMEVTKRYFGILWWYSIHLAVKLQTLRQTWWKMWKVRGKVKGSESCHICPLNGRNVWNINCRAIVHKSPRPMSSADGKVIVCRSDVCSSPAYGHFIHRLPLLLLLLEKRLWMDILLQVNPGIGNVVTRTRSLWPVYLLLYPLTQFHWQATYGSHRFTWIH